MRCPPFNFLPIRGQGADSSNDENCRGRPTTDSNDGWESLKGSLAPPGTIQIHIIYKSDTNTDRNTDYRIGNTDLNTDTNRDTNTDKNKDTNTDTNTDTITDTNADTNTDTNTDEVYMFTKGLVVSWLHPAEP